MSAKTDEILESLKTLSLLEASELVKQIEEAFSVSATASAGVVMAAPGAAAGGGEAAEEKTEFDVVLESFEASSRSRSSRLCARPPAWVLVMPRPWSRQHPRPSKKACLRTKPRPSKRPSKRWAERSLSSDLFGLASFGMPTIHHTQPTQGSVFLLSKKEPCREGGALK